MQMDSGVHTTARQCRNTAKTTGLEGYVPKYCKFACFSMVSATRQGQNPANTRTTVSVSYLCKTQVSGPYHVGSRGPATRIMFFLYVRIFIYIYIYIYTHAYTHICIYILLHVYIIVTDSQVAYILCFREISEPDIRSTGCHDLS